MRVGDLYIYMSQVSMASVSTVHKHFRHHPMCESNWIKIPGKSLRPIGNWDRYVQIPHPQLPLCINISGSTICVSNCNKTCFQKKKKNSPSESPKVHRDLGHIYVQIPHPQLLLCINISGGTLFVWVISPSEIPKVHRDLGQGYGLRPDLWISTY